MLMAVYTCQNATFVEITCQGSLLLLLYTSPASDSEVTNYATESVTYIFQFRGWLTSLSGW